MKANYLAAKNPFRLVRLVSSPGTSPTVPLGYLHMYTAQENTSFLQYILLSEVEQVLVTFPEPIRKLKAPNPSLWKQLQQLLSVIFNAFGIYAFLRDGLESTE